MYKRIKTEDDDWCTGCCFLGEDDLCTNYGKTELSCTVQDADGDSDWGYIFVEVADND